MTREMKYSGVEWIGDIPSEWKYKKIKYVYSIKKAKLPSALFENELLVPYLTMDYIRGATDSLQYAKDGDYCDENDLLLIWDGSNAGEMVYNHPCGYAPSTTAILKLKCSMEERYSKYYLIFFETELRNNTNGMGIPHINGTFLRNSYMLFPPLSEQKKIADFLDGKVSEIDKIIAETKSSIENYKEYKQSVITEAVTKGLDKNVPMKDSGIEWIGDIPVGWKVVRIKNTSSLRGRIGWQGLKTSDYQDNGAYLITGTDFRNGIINWQTCVHISDERFVEDENIHIHENDLLITKDGTIGKVAIAKNCPEKVSLNSGVLLIRNDKNIKYNGLYMYFMLNSNVFWKWYNSNQMGNSTIKHLYQGQFENFSFPLPKLNEQTQIAEYLDIKCTEIENSISEKEQLISNLEEYKKSLIYEYVTGKRTVE